MLFAAALSDQLSSQFLGDWHEATSRPILGDLLRALPKPVFSRHARDYLSGQTGFPPPPVKLDLGLGCLASPLGFLCFSILLSRAFITLPLTDRALVLIRTLKLNRPMHTCWGHFNFLMNNLR
jgi:hypothetical protein